MKAPVLPDFSFNFNDYARLTRHLTLRETGTYMRLLQSYWEWSELPLGDAKLAAICGVEPKSFLRMRDHLMQLFEIDEAGRWPDYDLEARRAEGLKTIQDSLTIGSLTP